MEVKFADEQSIYRFIISVVRKALGSNDLVPSLEMNAAKSFDRSFASLRHAALPQHFTGDFGSSEKNVLFISIHPISAKHAPQSIR